MWSVFLQILQLIAALSSVAVYGHVGIRGSSVDNAPTGRRSPCGNLSVTENVNCSAAVFDAYLRGKEVHPAKYFIFLETISKVTLAKAKIEDMQRLFFCGKFGKSAACGLPPCSCSRPPCDICEFESPPPKIERSRPFVLQKRYDLSKNPRDDFDVVVIPDENLTHSCANYTDDPETVFSRDGKLVLKVASECSNKKCLSSGRIMSKESFKYGIFTFSAKVPKCNYVWPAIWLLPEDTGGRGIYGPWPCSGEIDILETVHDGAHGTFNLVAGFGSTGGSKGNCFPPATADCNQCLPPLYCVSTTLDDHEGSQYFVEDVNCSNEDSHLRQTWKEHVFALYWQPGRMATFIDPTFSWDREGNIVGISPKNEKTDQVTSTDSKMKIRRTYKTYEHPRTPTWKAVGDFMKKCHAGRHEPHAPFDRPFKIVLNIAVGGYEGSACKWGTDNCTRADLCGAAVGSELILSDISIYQMKL